MIEREAEVSHSSAASAWEITTKFRLGRLPGTEELARDFSGLTREADLKRLAVGVLHGEVAGRFADPHKDPLDLMLIAQALIEGLTLVSNAMVFDRFGVARIW